MQSISYWEEIVVKNKKIYFKEKSSNDNNSIEKIKREIMNGKSVIPPK
jgi:hypothetical protein